MCKLCDQGSCRNHFGSRRNFLKGRRRPGSPLQVSICSHRDLPQRSCSRGSAPGHWRAGPALRHSRRFGDVDGPEGRRLPASRRAGRGQEDPRRRAEPDGGHADEIDATGRIVMPGFIDTHHHQFETALRSFLADGVLINDGSGSPSGSTTYYEYILLTFAPVYRPQDVYINELFGGLSQLDDGVTTVHDVSQIHHSPAALGRRHPGAVRYGAPRRLRLFRGRGKQSAPTMHIRRTRFASNSSGSLRVTSSSP